LTGTWRAISKRNCAARGSAAPPVRPSSSRRTAHSGAVRAGGRVGDGTGPQPWQQLADLVVRKGRELKARRARVALCGDEWPAVALETLAEGLWLASYSFDELKSKRASRANGLAEVVVTATRRLPSGPRRSSAAICWRRDLLRRNLINWPAAIVTPAYLAAEARALARTQGCAPG